MQFRLTMPQLLAVARLAENGSFRDAASALGVSQPALSRTIQLIEGRLGVRLFDRDSRHVALTPAGEKFLPMAERLMRDYDATFRELEAFVGGRQGHIRVSALPSVASALLAKTIADFQRKRPSVRIDIIEDIAGPVHRAVEEGLADFGVVTPPQGRDALSYRPLVKDELVLVCRKDDPLAASDSHDWSVFAERPFIGMSQDSGLHGMLESGFLQLGMTVEPRYNCRQPATVCRLIEESLGIAALPRLTLTRDLPAALTWRPLRGLHLARSIGVVTQVGRSLSPSALLFIREVESHARLLAPSGEDQASLAPSAPHSRAEFACAP